MKKILKEWKNYLNETTETEIYGNEGFEKRFVDSFSRSTQDRAFLNKLKTTEYDMTGMSDKDVGQLQSGMSHTWLTRFGKSGASFIIQEKVDRYLASISNEDRLYLEKFFGRIFGELNHYKMNRPDVDYKRPVAYLGRHQMQDWWIADDGIDMFYVILKKSMRV
tara:strand:+ start:131 stop:622 length:492 start_codon:yes stop_codon:yes gene_type:complete